MAGATRIDGNGHKCPCLFVSEKYSVHHMGFHASSGFSTGASESIVGVDSLIKSQLDDNIKRLETTLDRDVLAFVGRIMGGVDELVRDAVESFPERRSGLAVILDTEGGVVEIVERMVDTIRHHYEDVSFIIPDRAMSAGTIFALSGDAIHMDYFSVLGPIDPQVQSPGKKHFIPALAYLVQYNRLINKSAEGTLTTAELMMLEKLDLAELQQFEEARELSIELLQKWLVKYKFKDWTKTATKNSDVSDDYKKARAKEIAQTLSDSQRWHSHGRGISMAELQSDSLKLKIDDFGKNAELSKLIRGYFRILRDYMFKDDATHLVHTRYSMVRI